MEVENGGELRHRTTPVNINVTSYEFNNRKRAINLHNKRKLFFVALGLIVLTITLAVYYPLRFTDSSEEDRQKKSLYEAALEDCNNGCKCWCPDRSNKTVAVRAQGKELFFMENAAIELRLGNEMMFQITDKETNITSNETFWGTVFVEYQQHEANFRKYLTYDPTQETNESYAALCLQKCLQKPQANKKNS